MVDFVITCTLCVSVLEEIAKIFVKVSTKEMRALGWCTLLCVHDTLQITCFKCVIVLCYFFHDLFQLLRVCFERIVLQIELYLFYRLSKHELMLLQGSGYSVFIIHKALKNLYNLFEIKFFEIDVKPSDEKVNKIALF